MKKKLCAALLLLAALAVLSNIPAWASEADNRVLASGECGASGNDVTWTLYRDGRFVVSGVGAMYNYASADSLPWYSHRNDITTVAISNGVTTVGDNAFRGCGNLKSVTLPASLTSIGDVAFYQCSSLAEVTIPENVTKIGANAFGYCALTTVTIPEKVKQIGDSAFFRCSALTAINVGDKNAAYSSQDGVLFDKIASTEGTEATSDKSLLVWYPSAKPETTYDVPAGITKIGPYAFQSASRLTKVTIPEGVTEIGEWAFSYDAALTDMELPVSLTSIKDYAFYECTGLSDENGKPGSGTVTFAGSRQQWAEMEIGTAGNYRLTNANVDCKDMRQDNVVASGECGALGSNASWSLNTDGDFVISGDGEMLNYRSADSVPWAQYREKGSNEKGVAIKTVTVEGSVTRNADGVTTKRGVTNVGDYAFYDCAELTTVTLPPTLQTIGANAFANCAALNAIDLSKTALDSIGDYAFSGSAALTEIPFPETLKTIGDRAFLRSGLTSVTIPASVTSVGKWTFRWCESLSAFVMEALEDGEPTTDYTSIGDYALADCAALESVSFTENLTVLGEYALARDVKLAPVFIPASVSGIGSCAFYGCPMAGATSAGVTVDEENQFYSSLNGMLLNKDQTCIFYYPSGRTSDACAIPGSVTSVAPFAFDGASSLKEVYYDYTETQWKEILEPNIGDYNEPLLAAHPNYVEDSGATATSIDSFTVESSETGKTAVVNVHCGENALGAEAMCATYDEEGRFLSMESQEIAPGTDEEISFALPDKAMTLRLFVLDGYALPCCPSETHSLSEE